MRTYKLAANAIWLLHVAWILVIVGGIPLMMLRPEYGYIELGFILATLVAQKVFHACPLTLLEEGLREKHNPEYRRRPSFLDPLWRRFGIRARPITPVHLGILAVAVFVLTNVVRK